MNERPTMNDPTNPTCAEAREAMHLALDDDAATLPGAAARHLDDCDACRATWEELRELEQTIGAALREDARGNANEIDIEARVMAAIAAEPADARRGGGNRAAIYWAAAAMMMLGAGLALWLRPPVEAPRQSIATGPTVTPPATPRGGAGLSIPSVAFRVEALPPMEMLEATQAGFFDSARRLWSPAASLSRLAGGDEAEGRQTPTPTPNVTG